MNKWIELPENSLREFVQYLNQKLPGTADIFFSYDKKSFAEGVEISLHAAIMEIESSSVLYPNSNELQLSTILKSILRNAAIPCEAEAYTNGHVDITICHPKRLSIRCLGECKIWAGYNRHKEGCEQLLSRYSTGREARSFVLEFFKNNKMYEHLESLRENFSLNKPLRMVATPIVNNTIEGAFVTAHIHFTEQEIEILHLGCNVFHPKHKKMKDLK